MRTARSSVLGSGNPARSCPQSSNSVLGPGGPSLRTETSISVLSPGGPNLEIVKLGPRSWRTEFDESQILQTRSSGRQDRVLLSPQTQSWRTGLRRHPPLYFAGHFRFLDQISSIWPLFFQCFVNAFFDFSKSRFSICFIRFFDVRKTRGEILL